MTRETRNTIASAGLPAARLDPEAVRRRLAELHFTTDQFELLDNLSDQVTITDLAGNILWVNRALLDMMSCERAELLGRWVGLFDVPARNAISHSAILLALQQHGAWSGTIKNVDKHGQEHPIELRCSVLRNGHGQPVAYYGVGHDISGVEVVKRDLRSSEEQLRSIAAAFPGAVYQFQMEANGEFRVPYMSAGAATLFERPLAELTNHAYLFDDVHPDDVPGLYASIRASAENLTIWSREFRLVKNGGRIKWVRGVSKPQPRNDGSTVWNGVLLDSTPQRQAEDQLRQREQRYAMATEAGQVSVWEWWVDQDLVVHDPSFWRRLGYDPLVAEASPSLWRAVLHPDDVEEISRRARALAEGHSAEYHCEHRVLTHDGQVRWVEARGRRVETGSRVLGTVIDVTTRKAAEQALAESNAYRDAVFDNSAVGICVVGNDRRIREVNPQIGRMFGYPREDLLGQSVAMLHVSAAAFERFGQEVYAPAMAGDATAEYALRRRDGSVLWAVVSGRPIKLEGREQGVVWVLMDVTERRELEERMRQSQKMEAVGQLAGGVAHDFNNILTAVLGNVELLRLLLPEDETLREPLEQIEEAGQRAAALTRQLLTFGRRQPADPQLLDARRIIREMEKMLRRLLPEHVEFGAECADGALVVKLDEAQFQQVVLNLVVNARDAMPDGGRLTLRLGARAVAASEARQHADVQPGTFVELEVADTGVGMNAAVRQRLFEPFFSTKGPGTGSGLGLATVHGIVQAARGFITVDSILQQGTTMRVLFPAHAAEPAAQPRSAAGPVDITGTETIVVAEDDPAVRQLACAALRAAGFDVLAAEDGKAALELVERESRRIDLLLTDVVMPGMNGRKLAESLRARVPALRVLFVSGYASGVIRDFDDLRSDEYYLRKPYSPGELLHKIRKILDEADQR